MNYLSQCIRWLATKTSRIAYKCAAGIPMPHLASAAALFAFGCRCVSRTYRHLNDERVDTVCVVLRHQVASVTSIRHAAALELLIDLKAFFGDNHHPEWASIDAIAARLADVIKRLRHEFPQRPILLSPFHYCSQYANVMVCDQLRHHVGMASLSLVSAIADDKYGSDDARLPHIHRLRSHIDGKEASFSLMREMKRQGLVILFADAMPSALAASPMETVSVTMFDRPARIQNGVFRLGALVNAWLLPFYLKFHNGHFDAVIFDAIDLARTEAPQQLADHISSAFADNYGQWLAPSHPDFYYFSPEK